MQINKITPVLFINKEDCCGCYACENTCKRNAIVMKQDKTGFEYPVIDEKLCIGCKICIKVCPLK